MRDKAAKPPPVPGWEKAKNIDGWFSQQDARLLSDLSKTTQGTWCEIGCYKGRSTVILAETGETGFAIDTFTGSPEMPEGTDTYDEFMRNIEPYDNVIVIRKHFMLAARHIVPYLTMLHLDAEHSYEATMMAFDMYAPKLLRGGVVAFHDARGGGWPEVERFAHEVSKRAGWEDAGVAGHLVCFRKQ